MPSISEFYGITIYMYWSEHNPPHFHAIYQNQEVVINIKTLEVSSGSIPRRGLNLILDWAEKYQNELLNNWNLCQENEKPNHIDPLK